MAKKAKVKGDGLTRYTTYFWRGTNPVLERLDVARQKSGKSNKSIAGAAHASTGTLGRWFHKKPDKRVRSPHWNTLVAVARGIGPEGEQALIDCIRSDGRSEMQKPKK